MNLLGKLNLSLIPGAKISYISGEKVLCIPLSDNPSISESSFGYSLAVVIRRRRVPKKGISHFMAVTLPNDIYSSLDIEQRRSLTPVIANFYIPPESIVYASPTLDPDQYTELPPSSPDSINSLKLR